MGTTLHQDSDARARIGVEPLAHDVDDLLGFVAATAAQQRVHAHAARRGRLRPRDARRIAHRSAQHVVRGRQHFREAGIHPLDHRDGRAEIHGERERFERDAAEAPRAHVEEEPHLGTAEPVDRLHRVPDEEQRAAISPAPAGRERFEQPDLRLRRVLELVDQHVLELRVEDECGIGRCFGGSERLARRRSKARIVRGTRFREHEFEFRSREPEHAELREQRAPLLGVVTRRGQSPHRGEQRHRAGMLGQPGGHEARAPLE